MRRERIAKIAGHIKELPPEQQQQIVGELKEFGELGILLQSIHPKRRYTIGDVKEYRHVTASADSLLDAARNAERSGPLSEARRPLKPHLDDRLEEAWGRQKGNAITRQEFRTVVEYMTTSMASIIPPHILRARGSRPVETRSGRAVLNAVGDTLLAECNILKEAGYTVGASGRLYTHWARMLT